MGRSEHHRGANARRTATVAAIAVAAIAVAAIGASVLAGCGHDTVVRTGTPPGEDRLSVSGTASVSAVPDVADLGVGVHTFDADAVAAVTASNEATAAIVAAVIAQGVEASDLRTAAISLTPQRDSREEGDDTITGYVVRNRVDVIVRDVSRTGAVLQAAIDAGANEVTGLSFRLSQPDSLGDLARQGAVEDARRRADVLAKAAGVKVGKVISLSESLVSVPPGFRGDFGAGDEGGAVPVEPGEVEVTARVEVVFAIR